MRTLLDKKSSKDITALNNVVDQESVNHGNKEAKILTHFVLKGTAPPCFADSWVKLKRKET